MIDIAKMFRERGEHNLRVNDGWKYHLDYRNTPMWQGPDLDWAYIRQQLDRSVWEVWAKQ